MIQSFAVFLLGTLFWVGAGEAIRAQEVVLQLEKVNSPKTRKFVVGDRLEYRTRDDAEWQRGQLERLVPEEQLVIFNNRLIALDQITAIRHGGPRRWSASVGASLVTFGATWGALSLISGVVDAEGDPLTVGDAVVAGGAVGLGYAILRLFRYRRIPLGGRYRLRLLDLRVDAGAVTN